MVQFIAICSSDDGTTRISFPAMHIPNRTGNSKEDRFAAAEPSLSTFSVTSDRVKFRFIGVK